MNKQDILRSLKIIMLSLAITIGVNIVFAAGTWSPAPSSPPNNNAEAPLNVSANAQAKAGALSVGTPALPANGYVFDAVGSLRASSGWFSDITSNTLYVNNGAEIYGPDFPLQSALKVGLGTDHSKYVTLSSISGGSLVNSPNSPLYLQLKEQGQSKDQNTLINVQGGNVGVGTDKPRVKLDVVGQIDATGDICTDSGGGVCLSKVGNSGGGGSVSATNFKISTYGGTGNPNNGTPNNVGFTGGSDAENGHSYDIGRHFFCVITSDHITSGASVGNESNYLYVKSGSTDSSGLRQWTYHVASHGTNADGYGGSANIVDSVMCLDFNK